MLWTSGDAITTLDLGVIEACTAVQGRVASVHRAVDGDLHIGLDPEQKSTLNLANVMHAQHRLIVEVVCDHIPRDKEVASGCAGYAAQLSAWAIASALPGLRH